MPITYNCTQVGQNVTFKNTPFKGSDVQLDNIHKELDNRTFIKLKTFHTRKEAVLFCQQWSLPQTQLVQVSSRFQLGWAIGLGHSYFVPEYAEGLLFAQHMGLQIDSINDENMWIN
jgi:hypothetical protein